MKSVLVILMTFAVLSLCSCKSGGGGSPAAQAAVSTPAPNNEVAPPADTAPPPPPPFDMTNLIAYDYSIQPVLGRTSTSVTTDALVGITGLYQYDSATDSHFLYITASDDSSQPYCPIIYQIKTSTDNVTGAKIITSIDEHCSACSNRMRLARNNVLFPMSCGGGNWYSVGDVLTFENVPSYLKIGNQTTTRAWYAIKLR